MIKSIQEGGVDHMLREVIIKRIQEGVDHMLKEEPSGFWRDRGTT